MDEMSQDSGNDGRAVIGLHGWFGSATAWQPLAAHLENSQFGYHFMDFRGYGSRAGASGRFTIAEAAADVLEFADELGLERFCLLGHSMGGSVMQRVYADAPERVRAMFGISPVPASGIPFDDATWELFRSAADSADVRRQIIDFTTGGRLEPRQLDAMVEHSVRNSEVPAVSAYLEAWASTDFHAEINGSRVPVKVLIGRNDPAVHAELIRSTFGQWYPHFDLIEFADAGHYAAEEVPQRTAEVIEEFLRDAAG